jgi:hypothetical protein
MKGIHVGKVLFAILMLISLLGYGVVVVLSINPVRPDVASRGQYAAFILYGSLFYAISTGLHLGAPVALFDTYFVRPGNRKKKLYLCVLPALMLLYMIYVIAYGQ